MLSTPLTPTPIQTQFIVSLLSMFYVLILPNSKQRAWQRVLTKTRMELIAELTGPFSSLFLLWLLAGGFISFRLTFSGTIDFVSSQYSGSGRNWLPSPAPREALVSLGFISFSLFWPMIRFCYHSTRKSQSSQRQQRVSSTSSVIALDTQSHLPES